jgi:hypothetical protein
MVIGANGDASAARGAGADASRTDGYQVGAAYVYGKPDGHTWVQTAYLKAQNADSNDAFGQSVAVTADTVFVGAPFESSASRTINGDEGNNNAGKSGAVYVYR